MGDNSQDSDMDVTLAKVRRAEPNIEMSYKVLITAKGGSGSPETVKRTKEATGQCDTCTCDL